MKNSDEGDVEGGGEDDGEVGCEGGVEGCDKVVK